MIERRYPIQSVLAERKMFANGGMVSPPMQQPMQQPMTMQQPMQQPMTMQQPMQPMPMQQPQQPMQPQQPQGIMASSQPLVDAIAADALNPQGGGTLSGDDGTLSMAQGGAVGFANGGGVRAPQYIRIPTLTPTLSPEGGFAVSDPANPITMTPSEVMEETNAERVKRLFPDSAANPGSRSFDEKYPEFKREADAGRPKSYAEELAARILGGGESAIQDVVSEMGQDVSAVYGLLFDRDIRAAYGDRDKDSLIDELATVRAVNEMVQRRPDLKDQILPLAKRIVQNAKSDGVKLDQAKFTEAIAYGLGQGEIKQAEGYFAAQTDAKQLDLDAGRSFDQGEFAGAPTSIELTPREISQSLQDDPVASAEPAITDDDLGGTGFPIAEAPVAGGDVVPEVDVARGDVVPEVDVAKLVGQGPLPPEDAAYTAAKQAAEVLDTDKEADPETIDEFKKKFMDAMPEYEGVSEEERGWAIAEAGLRIMAGKSSNAITNIAEGLKGLGPELMKGAKEKREWDRTVNLSAAKYALSNVKADRTAAAALAKERRARVEYVANKAGVDPRDGRKFKKGDVLPFTAGDVHDGVLGKFAPGTVVLPKTFSAIQDGIAAANTLLNKGKIKYSDYQRDRKDYAGATKNLLSGLQMKLLIGDAAEIIKNNPKAITGATSFLKRATDDVLNAIGIQEKKRSGYLADLKASESAKYQAIMKRIGTKMITQILNEGNRTVSDADRRRVDELVGAYGDYFSGFAASEGALRIKLEGLATDIDFGIQEAQASMDVIEGSYNNRLNADRYNLLQRYKRTRFDRFQGQEYNLFRIGEDGVYRRQRGQ